jgi:hypothetical protein
VSRGQFSLRNQCVSECSEEEEISPPRETSAQYSSVSVIREAISAIVFIIIVMCVVINLHSE